jgi:FkbM family methyltransferase
MPTEHGLGSDLKFYLKKGRLLRYLRAELRHLYFTNKTKWSFLLEDYIIYRFDPFRVLAKKFELGLPKLMDNHIRLGNYFLDCRVHYTKPPIIYSMGVLTDVSFDKAAADYFNTDVYLFDPAPVAIEFMAKQQDSRLKFQPIGVWTEDKTMEFMFSKNKGRSPSMFIPHDGGVFFANCKSISTIMAELSHQNIDILKLDIEGAALPLLEHLLDSNIQLPSQIVAEFENINPNLIEFCDFYVRIDRLIRRLKGKGFEVANLPRDFSFYRSVELLFSRITR